MQMAAGVYILLGLYSFTLPDTPPRARHKVVSVAAIFGLDVILRHRETAFWIFIACTLALMVPKSFYDTYANAFFAEKDLHMNLFAGRLEATGIQPLGQIFETFFLIRLPFLLARTGIQPVLVIGMVAWAGRCVRFVLGSPDH